MGKLTIDIQVDGNTETILFADALSAEPSHSYYVGWTVGTPAEFASKTGSQLAAIAEQKESALYTGTFGNNTIFFLMYLASDAPQSIVLTSSGVAMEQDVVSDNTCPHADAAVGDTNYKVFGIWFHRPEPTDTVTLTF